MSQSDEDDERQRSVKLCQLVYDRQTDNEIGCEIRKLLEHGVLIDFQDQNRNKKTAIHLAVGKCDVSCVKLLLQLKLNLEVKDGDGRTPAELAESKGFQNILDILENSAVDVVNESYIEVFDYKSMTLQKLEAIKRPTFKVLKLINCPNAKKVWNKLNGHGYTTTLNESSHLFVFVIETKESKLDNDLEMMRKSLNLQRPMIVQLTSLNCHNTKIYFKDDKKEFVDVTDTQQITQGEFEEAVESKDECNFKLLVSALRSNLLGHFSGNLLNTKLNANGNRNKAVIQFARSNALCHRFFKLFDECPIEIDRIVATLSFKGNQSLLALLDLPFEPKDGKLKLSDYQRDILGIVDQASDYSLLMMASKENNLDAVKLLLRCGSDFNYLDICDNHASDICWKMKAFDCLAELIEAGSPYPNNFLIKELDGASEAHKRITKMIGAINSFHENIKHGKTEEVKKFISSHPHIIYAFDISNKCALTVALESEDVALQSNQVGIFSLLMSKGFEPGGDDEYYKALESKNNRFKNEIRSSHGKYFKEAFDEPHLKRLLKMFRLSFGSKDRAKCSTVIRKMFDELNEIDDVIPILQICSLSAKLKIVFDFNCDSVVDMVVAKGLGSYGIAYSKDGFIYVGAKDHEEEFYRKIGTLIHELTHYAMYLTYGNDCKPYDDDDDENEKRFETITTETKKICDDNPLTDSIVATVFTRYDKSDWHQELIVRVPELLAFHKRNPNPEALEAAERSTPELFKFYRDKFLKDVESKCKVLLHKYLIAKINNQTGISQKIDNLNVRFENVEINLLPSIYVITSNAPQMTLSILHPVECNDSQILVTLEQVAIGNILEKITKVNLKESATTLIVDCIGQIQKYPESLRKLLENIKSMRTIVLVMTAAESLTTKENFPKVECKTFTHKWGELTESSKVNLLKQNVIFQGVLMELSELVDSSSEAMNFFPLGELLNCKNFKIGNELHQIQTTHKFYIARNFIGKGQGSRSFDELSQDGMKTDIVIISDEAGSGKSVTLFEIAKKLHVTYPDRWIQFIDLKLFIEAFKSVEDYEKFEIFEDFISEQILKDEPKFDQELFLQMFRDGKTFVLFDGFDEISPNYKKFLLHVLALFEPGSGNQLYITSRPHLEVDLENALGKFVFKLEEFSRESQISFLREYWDSAKLEISQNEFEVLSQRLLKEFSITSASKLIGLPLLMRMTAEIFENPIKENSPDKVESLNLTLLFKEFVKKYLTRWTKNVNEISVQENVESIMAGGILEIHHSIAIKHIFDKEFAHFDVDENDAEKIARVGLIRYDKTEKTFQFTHETFAEYFVANFICFHLNKKNQNPSHDCCMAIEILIEVLENEFDFKVIKTFLDQTIEAMKFNPNDRFCRSVSQCLGDALKSKNYFDCLRESLFASRENLSILLLSIGEYVEKKVLLQMLQSNKYFQGNSLFIAAAFESSSIVSTLCNVITTCTDCPKEIYQDSGNLENVLLRAAENENERVLTTLCEKLDSVFTKDEIKVMFQEKDYRGLNIISIAVDNINEEVFLELISLLPNYFSPDEIRSLLLAVDESNKNFFHAAVINNKSENLKVKFEVVKSNFNVEQQKALFYLPANAPNIFIHAALNRNEKIFETIIGCTLDVLSSDEIKFMLMGKDSEGSNLIHFIAYCGNEVILNELNSLLRGHISDDEIRLLLLEVNDDGQDCFRLAANNVNLDFKAFCETIGNLTPIEDQTRLLQQSLNEIDIFRLANENYSNETVPVETIRDLLTRRDHLGSNCFHEVACRGNVEQWNKLISFAQARFSAEELKGFLNSCDNAGENCLHQAIRIVSNENIVEAICETIKTALSIEDQKEFVQHKNSRLGNVFQKAAANRKLKAFFSLYNGLSTILSEDEIKEMLKQKDSAGFNILCCFTRKFHNLEWRDLMPFLQKILKKDEMKDLLFDVSCEGKNFFHYTVEASTEIVIKSAIKVIKQILSLDDQRKFFGIKSPNIFYLALKSFGNKIFSTLHRHLSDVLTESEIKALIQEKNDENKNILQLMCQQGSPIQGYDARLRDFLKVLKVICDADELKNFLTHSDNDGRNCFHLAAQLKEQFFLKELFSIIRSKLNIDDQRELIRKCDEVGNNIFILASHNEEPEIYFVVESFAKQLSYEIRLRKLIRERDTNTDGWMDWIEGDE